MQTPINALQRTRRERRGCNPCLPWAESVRLGRYAAHAERLVLGLLVAFAAGFGLTSPTDDLASPSQETRDATAKVLRGTWAPPARTNWEPLLSAIKVGMHETNVLELLRPLTGLTNASGVGSGSVESTIYRLDD